MDDTLRRAIEKRIKQIPIFATLETEFGRVEDGYYEASIPRRRRYDGVFETLHGGILTTLADSVACLAVFTLTGPKETVVTTDISIRFLAPCHTGVTAKAKVIKLGRTMCPVSVDITDEAGKRVAVATINYMRLDR